MNHSELDILDKWQSDPSFINWINKENDADIAKWNAYFEANPQHTELAELAKYAIKINPKPIPRDKEKSLAALSRLHEKIAAPSTKNTTKIRKMQLFKVWQIAASFLILAACFWGYATFNSNGKEIIVATQDEQQEINLADGTNVILNTHSTLKYFEKDVRNVELIGEAYFDVSKQTQDKALFQVKTEDLTVTVLGTEFNVNSENGKTSVYLDEGKVKLNFGDHPNNTIEMQPGDLVRYSKKTNKILENRKANTLEETAWKEKVILFEEAPLSEILEKVSIVYGISFEHNLSAEQDQSFTGGIPVNDLNIVLQTLKDVYQLDFKKIEEKYLINQQK